MRSHPRRRAAPRKTKIHIPLLEGCCEKIGRASLLASHRPSKSLPHEARREPRPPDIKKERINCIYDFLG
ncbi:MAG: hypothetical protein DMG05_22595 [Acidobacteria bacterium]|nr:MAG: hypothetical protein DMG05_22595 [Acidobacteriota bacterium]